MFDYENFKEDLPFISPDSFESKALELFNYQFHKNKVYHQYCNNLGRTPENTHQIKEIPFLPIEFFKTQKVVTDTWEVEKIFQSSGTTLQQRSKHYVRDIHYYHYLSKKIFESHYGPLKDFQIIALLPSYLEQGDSSLISMVDHFIQHARAGSQYCLNSTFPLRDHNNPKRLIIGVSYALLDLCEQVTFNDPDVIIMETGGMKGRRKEMIKEELHYVLKTSFDVSDIHSEYGMTELTSQAYGKNGVFQFPPWVKVMIRDINDPFTFMGTGKTGGLNIIDLGNIDSCAFIETQDLGKKAQNDHFEVLGRFDNSDIRGCNLLI